MTATDPDSVVRCHFCRLEDDVANHLSRGWRYIAVSFVPEGEVVVCSQCWRELAGYSR